MPRKTILEISAEQRDALLRELRRWRCGLLLNLHIQLLAAAGKTPTEIAGVLFCSRSSVCRAVSAFQTGKFDRRWRSPELTSEAPAPPLSRFAAPRPRAQFAAAAPLRLGPGALELYAAGADDHRPDRSGLGARVGAPGTPRGWLRLAVGEIVRPRGCPGAGAQAGTDSLCAGTAAGR